MQLQVKAQHASVSDSVRAYAEKRLSKLSRRLYEQTAGRGDPVARAQPVDPEDHVAEGVVFTKGPNLVARESATSYEAAIDRLVDKLERQIERYRDKRVLEPRRQQNGGATSRPATRQPPSRWGVAARDARRSLQGLERR